MPALEMAQETGKLISWLKKEGDSVAKGQPLLEIETDKAVMEIESPSDGILAGITVNPGTDVPVGQTIAWILAPGEMVPRESSPVQTGRMSTTQSSTAPSLPKPAPVRPATHNVRTSPKARRLAVERGVDLATIVGSGPDGEILASDILANSDKPENQPAASLSAIARLMAERTTQSWITVPHFFVVLEVDATALKQGRDRLAPAIENAHGVKLTYTDLLVAVVARVLAKHPRVNSSWAGDAIRENPDVNISLAMAVEDGVVAPVIPAANKATPGEIALKRQDLAQRARSGKLRPQELSGGTFTLSNLGMFGIDAFTAIITPPQAAILAVGKIGDRVISVEGVPAVCPMMTMTLSSDHRVIDGARAAAFMRDLARAIEDLPL